MSRRERNRTSLLDSDSHVFVKIVDVDGLEEMVTKSSQVKQRDNRDNCLSGTQKKEPSLHFPQEVLLFASV